jgi:hypothetical protein
MHNDNALVTKDNIVNAETMEKIMPLQVTANLQIMIPTRTEAEYNLYHKMSTIEKEIILQKDIMQNIMTEIDTIDNTSLLLDIRDKINKKLHKKPYIEPKYMKTTDAAVLIGVDPSFLTKRQGKVFKLGEHFHKPEGESIVRWDITALEKWILTQKKETGFTNNKLDSLLKRR